MSTADFRDARYHELPVQTRRRPSMLGGDYHHTHAAAAHAATMDRDRYMIKIKDIWAGVMGMMCELFCMGGVHYHSTGKFVLKVWVMEN